MAKKQKTLDAEIQIDSSNGLFTGQTSTSQVKAVNEDKAPIEFSIGRETVTQEMKEKLLQYEETLAQNSKLLHENNELTTKLAFYIEELDSLRNTNTAPSSNKDQVDLRGECEEWKQKYQSLRAMADKQLERISDLTFENANLNAQIRELTNGNINVTGQIPAKPMRDTKLETAPFNPYKANGYSSWN